MPFAAQVWAVDVSEYELWSQNDRGQGLIRALLVNDETECQRVTRYVREADQIRSLCGKLLVRLAVCSSFPTVLWSELRFVASRQGRPYLQTPQLAFDYNITHDGDWVAVVFAVRASLSESPPANPVLGIDVMEIHLPTFERDVDSFVETMDMTLTQRERDWILHDATPHELVDVDASLLQRRNISLDAYARLVRLYTLWTYKEAFTKARGLGLSLDFARIELAAWNRHRDNDEGCTVLHTLPPPPATTETASDDKLSSYGALRETLKTVEGSVHDCVFRDALLPPGRVHDQHAASTSAKTRPGMGTGFASLLVVAVPHDSKDDRQMPKYDVYDERRRQQRLNDQDAEASTYLQPRRWTMAELVEAALVKCNKRG